MRDALVAGACGAILLGAAIWFDDRREDRAQALAAQQATTAEVLENVRFVRQPVMEPSVTLRPFRSLNLRGASLRGLPLGCPKGAKPASADQGCADLTDADLTDSDLHGADLHGAILTRVRLTHADLSGADLRDKDFPSSTDLKEAFFLFNADLTGVRYNDMTRWPKGFKPPYPAARAPN